MPLDDLVAHSSLLARIRRRAQNRLVSYLAAASLALSCSKAVQFNTSQCLDQDQDSFYSTPDCGTLVDCDDTDPAINPYAAEYCDQIDNNCRDGIDEGVQRTFYDDEDKDGYGNPARFVKACMPLIGEDPDTQKVYVENDKDCDDNNAAINPLALEKCDGVDNNCNAGVDESLLVPTVPCTAGQGACENFGFRYKTCLGEEGWSEEYGGCDAIPSEPLPELCDPVDQDCDGNPYNGYNVGGPCSEGIGSCLGVGTYICSADGLDTACNAVAGQPGTEICDGLDNDCDGVIDDNLTPPVQACSIGSGECQGFGLKYKVCEGASGWSAAYFNCDAIAGQPGEEICDGLDNDCDMEIDESAEICDGLDNDCDGLIDEELMPPVQECSIGTGQCQGFGLEYKICEGASGWSAAYFNCSAVEGQPSSEEICDGLDNDCDGLIDERAEICDGLDNDCDGLIDEELIPPSWVCSIGIGACQGFGLKYKVCESVSGWSAAYFNCDAVAGQPSEEICDGLDNDCDMEIDEGTEICDGLDNDCDGEVDLGLIIPSQFCTVGIGTCQGWGLEYKVCQGQAGWSQQYFNCDAVAGEPGEEVCDGLDNDCDNLIDEGAGCCTLSTEVCDGLDNDCDGEVDLGLIIPSQFCTVGIGACQGWGLEYKVCQGQAGWSQQYFNCDAVAGEPGEEIADGIDNDCNGVIDDLEGICEIIDDFNRPDQEGLGNNAFGNPWLGSASYWHIINGAATVSNTTSGGFTWTYMNIGHRNIFDIVTKWKTSKVSGLADGALILRMNANNSGTGGLFSRSCKADCTAHSLEISDQTEIGMGYTPLLSPNVYYLTRFAYDGTNLKLKIWQEGTAEPAGFLISVPVANTAPSNPMISLGSTVLSGTLTIDYIIDQSCND